MRWEKTDVEFDITVGLWKRARDKNETDDFGFVFIFCAKW